MKTGEGGGGAADLTVLRKGTNMHIREVTKLHKHITGIPVYIYIIYLGLSAPGTSTRPAHARACLMRVL